MREPFIPKRFLIKKILPFLLGIQRGQHMVVTSPGSRVKLLNSRDLVDSIIVVIVQSTLAANRILDTFTATAKYTTQ